MTNNLAIQPFNNQRLNYSNENSLQKVADLLSIQGLMTLSGVAALGVYVAGFVAKRKAKAATAGQ
ncbi:hypothetical protein FVR03_02190 [Pontibacter qinzhouensis]|uniref:Uncharacterized protein n=1 Tax=Pontibacter qinzhouensis TaxID=2603253 RepID=A0A5C8KCV2_9BACT|nr:hypothetical protein [Pontibacter qinzhouensis]TXK52095.1 hypothetical protein FVR03_02190 [Pontibacter qinzhouensis]